ncbi:MAG: PEP/pyruvate-binding domain-containing protein [Candidatus Krumholzibacteriia bacterium]|nr:nucleotidyltransferase domain-containing protein [bacterium]MCB9517165.1 nucleotidyltransferase domain-containing protein [Candidatus Latescibacterota bacterium]
MSEVHETPGRLPLPLSERAKELDCLFTIEEQLVDIDGEIADAFASVLEALPQGWRFPDVCQGLIRFEDEVYRNREFQPTQWRLAAPIRILDRKFGTLEVYYLEERQGPDGEAFTAHERRLLSTIADRLAHFILHKRIDSLRERWEQTRREGRRSAWKGSLQMLRASDPELYQRIARKMLNYLSALGVDEARAMLQEARALADPEAITGESNVASTHLRADRELLGSDRPFALAAGHLGGEQILALVEKWLLEDRAGFFINILANPRSSLNEIAEAIRRYKHVVADGAGLPASVMRGLRVTLAQRFLTEQLDFLKVAKDYIKITDMAGLLDHMILPTSSQGKLGGKSAGLLLARRLLEQCATEDSPVGEIHVPRTWYVASDAVMDFIAYNDLEDVIEQKFKDLEQIRAEYPHLVQLFKDSMFPPDFVRGLSQALDDLGDVPLIVRSSSLLEDRLGTAFSGKYKSLFLPNQGSKRERLDAALDAIAEIYASTFGPDPIAYRRDRGLLEFSEEMGILIQEVVGRRAGRYWLPAFAGVAFSNNEFRWSPRIKREDGIVRLVPGLGTRAVDRVSDDYPILAVPGQPQLRANVAVDEQLRYAPRKVDLINLETNRFETVEVNALLKELGDDVPGLDRVYSLYKDGRMQKLVPLLYDAAQHEAIPTFDALLQGTPFLQQIRNMLTILAEKLETPIDLEFAHDGERFYLLQCRPQSSAGEDGPAPIPRDLPAEERVFSARRYVSNGWMPDLTHVVYVDPAAYLQLPDRESMQAVGQAVGRLNKLLPRRQFALMGPGRWGSRGDIRLGVPVTYADISNCALLVEIARRQGGVVPDLSFGTHFFQDLVESRIRYLPLYPEDAGVLFNDDFFMNSRNALVDLLPEHAALAGVIRLIDVARVTDGQILRVHLNADLDEALAFLCHPGCGPGPEPEPEFASPESREDHWRWRRRMVEHLATSLDAEHFGVKGLYLYGSVKNGAARADSDIDLLVHVDDDPSRHRDLEHWLTGWSQALAEMNALRTGYVCDRLLDVRLVTDQDIAGGDSHAAKIGAATDPALALPLGGGR